MTDPDDGSQKSCWEMQIIAEKEAIADKKEIPKKKFLAELNGKKTEFCE